MRYAPGLDGVRALAVFAVVVYHIGTTSAARLLPGGYLGVDVFFVLSGYLITSLLLVEAGRHGRISIKNFYIRRARRLLPALFALLVAVAAVGAFWLPQQAARLRGDLLASLAYVQNWWLVFQSSSYFANVGDRPPMLTHLWSLAVEEQYYLLWPLILIALVKLRARRRVMLLVVLVGVIASTAVGQLLYDPYADPSRVYYGTDTRALAPLLGGALAIAIQPWRHRTELPRARRVGLDLLGVAALAGLGVIAAWLRDTDELLYRGGFLVIAILAAGLVAVAGHPASSLARVLGAQPLRYLGERSYAIYLWHWPVCLLTRPGYDTPLTGWANAALRIAIAIALAEISYQLIEKPIRRYGFIAPFRRPRPAPSQPPAETTPPAAEPGPVVGRYPVPTAIPADGPTIAFPSITVRARIAPELTVIPPSSRPLIPLVRTAVLAIALIGGGTTAGIGLTIAASRPTSGIALGDQPPSTSSPTGPPRPHPGLAIGARVEFFGDSQGTSLLKEEVRPPDLANYIDAVDATTPGCGILTTKIVLGDGTRHDLIGCTTQQEHWRSRVDEDKPALSVVIIGGWELFDIELDSGQVVAFGTPDWDRIFTQQLTQGISILRRPGSAVALALVTCHRPIDPDNWYVRVGDERGRHLNSLMVRLADSYASGVYIVEPPAEFCREPIATDQTYRADGVHYEPKGAALFFRALLPQILAPAQPSRSPSASASASASVNPR